MLIESPLRELRDRLEQMARGAAKVFENGVAVLDSRSPEDVETVRRMDRDIDSLEMEIDERCMSLLIKEPYALDFRYVYSVAKTINDLERVGDQSKTIAKWALKLPPEEISADMRSLVEKASEALSTAVRALVEGSRSDAEAVLKIEFQVDELEDRIIESSSSIAEAFIAKALERIGDLATNVAEEVIFTVEGRDVRHGGYKDEGNSG